MSTLALMHCSNSKRSIVGSEGHDIFILDQRQHIHKTDFPAHSAGQIPLTSSTSHLAMIALTSAGFSSATQCDESTLASLRFLHWRRMLAVILGFWTVAHTESYVAWI